MGCTAYEYTILVSRGVVALMAKRNWESESGGEMEELGQVPSTWQIGTPGLEYLDAFLSLRSMT
jgi:hypothetical protein